MSREILFWAVKLEYGSLSLVSVTKLDKVYYYGKTLTGNRTHGMAETLIARFPSCELATVSLNHLRKAIDSVQENFDRAEQMRQLAIQVRDMAIKNAVEKMGGNTDFGKS